MMLDLVTKSTILIILGFAVVWLLRRQSASWRHLIWRTIFLALVLLPLSSALPNWQLRLLPQPVVTPILADEPILAPPAPSKSCCAISPSDLPARTPPPTPPQVDLRVLLAFAWGVGAFVALSRIGFGLTRLRTIARRSEPIRGIVRRATTDEPRCAVALGIVHPVVLLPRASREWPPSRRRIVVLHEFAHVRRRDFASNVVSELACALYWFNPLVWLGARAMRAEAESAADNEVLASGVRASDYASELLRMSSDLASRPRRSALVGASPMVQPKIESRLARILSPSLRRQGVATLPTLLVVGAGLLISAAIAGARIAQRQPPGRPQAETKLALERMRALGTATMMYSMDYDEVLPSAASTETARQIVMPYLRSIASSQSPTAGGRIVYNTSISARKLGSFASPGEVPAWIEILPNPSYPFGVAFVDGHRALITPNNPTAPANASVKVVRIGTSSKNERWEIRRGGRVFAAFPAHPTNNPRARSIDVATPEGLKTARRLVANAKPIYGSSISPLKVVAFFDYECPACRAADRKVQDAIKKAGNVALYYREFPLTYQHPLAKPASILSIKARLKGNFAFMAVRDELLSGDKLDVATLERVKRKFGLDLQITPEVQAAIYEDRDFASDLNVTFVPCYVLIAGDQVSELNTQALLDRFHAGGGRR